MAKNGGMSFSNNFVVSFEDGAGGFFDDEEVEYFCDEAQLPNVNTATGTQVGLYTGLGQIDYPHTRVFTDFQLSFLLDADLGILKSLNTWYGSIFQETAIIGPVPENVTLKENRVTRLAYPDAYVGTVKIRKTESGPESTTQRNPITYVMEKAYPYAIDAIPLQFGTSQITRVTANFKYQRHYTIDDNTNSVKDRALKPTIRTVRGGGAEVGVGANDLRGSSSGIA